MTRLSSNLSQYTLSVRSTAIADCVRGVRLLIWNLGVETVRGDGIFKVHRAIVHIGRVLLESSVHWLIVQAGWPLERSAASAVLVRRVGSVESASILLLTRVEGLVHRGYVRLDSDLSLGDVLTHLFAMNLSRAVTLSDTRIGTTMSCHHFVSIQLLLKVWAYRVRIECLHGKLVCDGRRVYLTGVCRRYSL